MLSLRTPNEIASDLAKRIRSRRLAKGWSQAELAARAGLKAPTYVLFERTGRIALIRLLKLLEVLDLVGEFDRIGRTKDLAELTLDDVTRPERKRGRNFRS
jgi:transcriptional regulator with XRE-family HTH domain